MMNNNDDNDGQMIFGDHEGLNLPDICLTDEDKPRKTSPRKLLPTGDRTRVRCVTGAHATAWPTEVDVSGESLGILQTKFRKVRLCVSI